MLLDIDGVSAADRPPPVDHYHRVESAGPRIKHQQYGPQGWAAQPSHEEAERAHSGQRRPTSAKSRPSIRGGQNGWFGTAQPSYQHTARKVAQSVASVQKANNSPKALEQLKVLAKTRHEERAEQPSLQLTKTATQSSTTNKIRPQSAAARIQTRKMNASDAWSTLRTTGNKSNKLRTGKPIRKCTF